jgi:hypothetical protein
MYLPKHQKYCQAEFNPASTEVRKDGVFVDEKVFC